jgi:hypothetical protein
MNLTSYSLNDYKEALLPKLSEIWEPRKEYIEKDLWVIRNFLSEEELEWLNEEANDPAGWYTTMRSPYGGNIKNKFLGYIPDYDENGNMLVPRADSKYKKCPLLFYIEKRLESVVPKHFGGGGALQSFFEVSDEQIIKEIGHDVEYAMDFHYERHDEDGEFGSPSLEGRISGAISVYVNDNFDGGILEFKNKPYTIKPEPGMFVNVPIYKEFEHRVTKVTNGNRHTLYGRSWEKIEHKHFSTNEDC